jgi:hypothetical protein
MTDPAALRQVMQNARAKQREDRYWFAYERLCEVLGQKDREQSDPIVWRFERSVHAFEELRDGRRASRTRQMMKRRGPVGTIKQWLTYAQPTDGYVALVNAGFWHLLGEAIPLDFPGRFTDDEMAVARYRIADAKEGHVSDPFLPSSHVLDIPQIAVGLLKQLGLMLIVVRRRVWLISVCQSIHHQYTFDTKRLTD